MRDILYLIASWIAIVLALLIGTVLFYGLSIWGMQ
jgi:hypothetical protein